MAQILINQYDVGLVGHVNVTYIDSIGQYQGTFGSSPYNGNTGGVAREDGWINMAHTTQVINVGDAGFYSSLSQSQNLHNTTVTTGSSYALLGANCVDYADDALQWAGHSVGIENYTTPGTLVDFYAEFAKWVSDVYWSIRNGIIWDDQRIDIANDFAKMGQVMTQLGGVSEVKDEFDAAYGDWMANSPASPIVIDLQGNGLETIGLAASDIYFDITGNGDKTRTGWVSPSDGFLVHDKNKNNAVDGVSEMFGGLNKGDGFAKLAELDNNGDGRIDVSDTSFSEIQIWQDSNSNGITDAGELRALADCGIREISVKYNDVSFYNNGNHIQEQSTVTFDEELRASYDVYFMASNSSKLNDGILTALKDNATISFDDLKAALSRGTSEISSGSFDKVVISGTGLNDKIDLSSVTAKGISYIKAGSGNDTVVGSLGNDNIVGGKGQDTLSGGAGADNFVFTSLSESLIGSPDFISDFSADEGDRIDISSINEAFIRCGFRKIETVSAFSVPLNETGLYYTQNGNETAINISAAGIGDIFSVKLSGNVNLNRSMFVM